MNKEFNTVGFGHPCFNPDAALYHGRIHLPVAPKCNIKCKYCDRKTGCVNENRPGVTTKVMDPYEAILYAKKMVNLLHPIEDEASYFIDRCLLLFTAGLTQSP
ncbi:hypothetical protein [Thermoanaerobacterium thermosaccharolyticum]|uniref:hypothetical protein n=1 Tax=Thermoanaerobacterium thermosaccharolyticum TaxID=1517 RepID=UPI0020A2E1C4|nr:hypothetical protein [Thermoanaerobacterium thermosaccharolyticum]MCP2238971.1 MoaA/NifB/PqqE/SkfB family radical SAM enzyme [Thermoanaerobacterium thermosaccharolyticum]